MSMFDFLLSRRKVSDLIRRVFTRSTRALETRKLRAISSHEHRLFEDGNLRSNSRVFILGNGPSLSATLEKYVEPILIDSDLITVNHFPRSSYYSVLKPKYHIVLDPHFGDKESVTRDEIVNTIYHINEDTNWPLTIFIPKFLKSWNYFKDISNPNVRIVYFETSSLDFANEENEFEFARDNRIFPKGCGMTVIHAALYITIVLGYKKNILLGADHSWHTAISVNQETNEIISNYYHFYDQDDRKSALVAFNNFNLTRLFKSWYEVFSGHEKLKRFSEYCGSEILNGSEFSWLDVYKRIKLEEMDN